MLAGSTPSGPQAFDLPSFCGGDVVRTASHLAHEPLLLHLAAELPKRLLELLGILDDYSHSGKGYRLREADALDAYSSTSGRTVLTTAIAAKARANRPITTRA